MIPVRLRLSGFLSYKETVEVDFTTFDLACISGANGAGKSTLLDAITWALFGQARRKDDAIIHNQCAAAEVRFDFRYENDLYRVQRTKPRDKSTLLEFAIQDAQGGWRALTEHSLRETDERIQQTLRLDYETFTNASFFLQGRADQFAQQRPSERKRILSNVLGLEVWESYKTEAAERRKRLEYEQSGVNAMLDEIEKELSEEGVRKERLQQLQESLEQAQSLRISQESAFENLKKLAASLETQRRLVETLAGQAQAAGRRREATAANLAQRQKEHAVYNAELAAEEQIRAGYAAWQAAREELERWNAVAARFQQQQGLRSKPLLAIESERSRLEAERKGFLKKEAEVRQQEAALPGLEADKTALHERVRTAEEALKERAVLEERLQAIQNETAEMRAENSRLVPETKEMRARIDQLTAVEGASCPVCGQELPPVKRQHLIDTLEAEGRDKKTLFEENKKRIADLESERGAVEQKLAALRRVDSDLHALERQMDQLDDRMAQIQRNAQDWQTNGAPQLAELTRRLETDDFQLDARAELAQVDETLKELGYDAAAHEVVRRAEQEGRASEEHLRNLEKARAALAPLEREINELQAQLGREQEEADRQEQEHQQARQKYAAEAASLPDLNRAEADVMALKEKENRLHMQVGGAVQAVEVLKAQRARREELTARREEIAGQIARYRMLEKAFSKDGVPALLIEQALPEIEEQANDILDRLSAGAMSVHFPTQKEFKDKNRSDKRETLDIIIRDAAGEREYEMFSGGEAFRVNFAIRLALSRVLAQRAGARLQTLVIDEGFGSQDAEGRQRLIEAINLVGHDFAKVLVITHLEELKDAFPARIEVEKTPQGSQVRVLA